MRLSFFQLLSVGCPHEGATHFTGLVAFVCTKGGKEDHFSCGKQNTKYPYNLTEMGQYFIKQYTIKCERHTFWNKVYKDQQGIIYYKSLAQGTTNKDPYNTRTLQVHNNLLIQPWPSSCWPAHRMGIYSNPLINGLIQHTFKINLVTL